MYAARTVAVTERSSRQVTPTRAGKGRREPKGTTHTSSVFRWLRVFKWLRAQETHRELQALGIKPATRVNIFRVLTACQTLPAWSLTWVMA